MGGGTLQRNGKLEIRGGEEYLLVLEVLTQREETIIEKGGFLFLGFSSKEGKGGIVLYGPGRTEVLFLRALGGGGGGKGGGSY